MDDHTAKGEAFDVARIMINIPISLVIPDSISVEIDGRQVELFVREYAVGTFCLSSNTKTVSSSGDDSSDSIECWNMDSVQSKDKLGSNSDNDNDDIESVSAGVFQGEMCKEVSESIKMFKEDTVLSHFRSKECDFLDSREKVSGVKGAGGVFEKSLTNIRKNTAGGSIVLSQ